MFLVKDLHWESEFIAFYVLANLIILFAYYYLPLLMWRLYRKRKDEIPNPSVIKLFIWFPLGCGLSRIGHVLMFWFEWPWIFFAFDWVSAIFFTIVAVRLREVIDYLIHIQTNEQQCFVNDLLKKEIETRQKANHNLEQMNVQLRFVVKKFEHILATEMWIHNKKQTLQELSDILGVMKSNYE